MTLSLSGFALEAGSAFQKRSTQWKVRSQHFDGLDLIPLVNNNDNVWGNASASAFLESLYLPFQPSDRMKHRSKTLEFISLIDSGHMAAFRPTGKIYRGVNHRHLNTAWEELKGSIEVLYEEIQILVYKSDEYGFSLWPELKLKVFVYHGGLHQAVIHEAWKSCPFKQVPLSSKRTGLVGAEEWVIEKNPGPNQKKVPLKKKARPKGPRGPKVARPVKPEQIYVVKVAPKTVVSFKAAYMVREKDAVRLPLLEFLKDVNWIKDDYSYYMHKETILCVITKDEPTAVALRDHLITMGIRKDMISLRTKPPKIELIDISTHIDPLEKLLVQLNTAGAPDIKPGKEIDVKVRDVKIDAPDQRAQGQQEGKPDSVNQPEAKQAQGAVEVPEDKPENKAADEPGVMNVVPNIIVPDYFENRLIDVILNRAPERFGNAVPIQHISTLVFHPYLPPHNGVLPPSDDLLVHLDAEGYSCRAIQAQNFHPYPELVMNDHVNKFENGSHERRSKIIYSLRSPYDVFCNNTGLDHVPYYLTKQQSQMFIDGSKFDKRVVSTSFRTFSYADADEWCEFGYAACPLGLRKTTIYHYVNGRVALINFIKYIILARTNEIKNSWITALTVSCRKKLYQLYVTLWRLNHHKQRLIGGPKSDSSRVFDFNHYDVPKVDLPFLRRLWRLKGFSTIEIYGGYNPTQKDRFLLNNHGTVKLNPDIAKAQVKFTQPAPLKLCGVPLPIYTTQDSEKMWDVSKRLIQEAQSPAIALHSETDDVTREKIKRFVSKQSAININYDSGYEQGLANRSMLASKYITDHYRHHDKDAIAHFGTGSKLREPLNFQNSN